MTDSEKVRWGQQHLSVPPAQFALRPWTRWGDDRKPLAPFPSPLLVCVCVGGGCPPLQPLPLSWTVCQPPTPPGGGTELLCTWKWGLGWGWAIPPALGSSWKCVPSLKLSFEYCDLVFISKYKKANPTTIAFSPFLHFVTYPSLASSLLWQHSVTHSHFIHIVCFCFFFLRNLTSTCLSFSTEYIYYINYTYTHTHVSG